MYSLNKWLGVSVITFLLLVGLVAAVEIDSKITDALDRGEQVSVIITLEDQPLSEMSDKSSAIVQSNSVEKSGKAISTLNDKSLYEERKNKLEAQKEMVKKVQDEVLSNFDMGETVDSSKVVSTKKITKKTNVAKGLIVGTSIPGVTFSTTAGENDYDFYLGHRFSTINGFSGKINKKALDQLVASRKVKKISLDKEVKISLDSSGPLINGNQVINVSVNGINLNGTGQIVCVVDTGIDYTHPALGGCSSASFLNGTCSKVIGGYDIADRDTNPVDSNSHGTHVAGIVASEDSGYKGVAPGAKLIAVKVFPGSSSSTNASNVIAGLDWCKTNSTVYNISIVTLSLGDGSQYNTPCDTDELADAANGVANFGIFVDVASGNEGYSSGISSPACASNVTSVGSVYDSNVGSTAWIVCTDASSSADKISCFSDSGNLLKLLAPGVQITSTIPGSSFESKDGTSMAAPHVAGVAAIVMQYWKLAYGTAPTFSQVTSKLQNTGVAVLDSRNNLIFPRIDVLAATKPFLNFTADSTANGTILTNSSTLINITSDVNLVGAVLEWNYNNGTIANHTMNQNTAQNFFYVITELNNNDSSYKIYGNDSFSTGISKIRTLSVDNNPPDITINTPKNNSVYNSNFVLAVSISGPSRLISGSNYSLKNSDYDNSSSTVQSNGSYSINSNSYSWVDQILVSNYADGNYTLYVFANNSVGSSTIINGNIIIDKTSPTISSHQRFPSTIYNNDAVIIKMNVTDKHLNSSAIIFSSNVTGIWRNYSMILESADQYNFSLSGTQNLTNQRNISYQFYALDSAQNVVSSDILSFVVSNRAPILLNIISPSNNSIIEVGNSTRFNATSVDQDNDALTYLWNFSDGTSTVSSQNTTHQFNSTLNYTVLLTVSDTYGEYNTSSIQVIINDTTLPRISSVSYNNEIHLQRDGDNQTISATLFDYSGILNSTLWFNSSKQNSNCTQVSTSLNCRWSWSGLNVGTYSISINTTDNFKIMHSNLSTFSFTVTSCTDGVQNGDESGVDCSGSCTTACSSGGSSGSSSGGGGGGGGGSSAASKVRDITPATSTPSAKVIAAEMGTTTETSSASTSSTTESSSSDSLSLPLLAEQKIDVNAKSDLSGNFITGFLSKMLHPNITSNSTTIVLGIMGILIVGLGSLYFVVREKD